jgi:hypothetical protein
MSDNQTSSTIPVAKSKARAKRNLLVIGALGLAAYAVAVKTLNGFVSQQNGSQELGGLSLVLTMLVLATGLGGAFIWSLGLWRMIDEAAKRAHLDAFYWGGIVSWFIIAPIIVLPFNLEGFTLPLVETLDMTASQLFSLGVRTTLLVTLTGYGVAWLIWWFTKR